MTDVHTNESPGRPKKKRRAKKQREQDELGQIQYGRAAIEKGKRLAWILKKGDTAELELGELADRLQPKYGEKKTLARFAEAIDLPLDRLNRCRSVYRAWKGIDIQGTSPNFGVLQALQGHPNRDEIIKLPGLTVASARAFMKGYRGTQEQKDGSAQKQKDDDWRVEEVRRWFNEAKTHADEAIKYGRPEPKYLDTEIMGKAIDDWDTLIGGLRLGASALNRLADELERVRPLAVPKPPLALPRPMFDDSEPTPDEAKPDEPAPSEEPPHNKESDNETPQGT
jgi:hypothetical protein